MLLLLLACASAVPPEAAEIEVARADIEDIRFFHAALVGGTLQGSGTLWVEDEQGERWSWPVRLRGATVGAIFQLGASFAVGPGAALDLSGVEGPLTADQLFGRYRGAGWANGAVLTGVRHRLVNEAGVCIDRHLLELGFAIYGGWESIEVSEGPPTLGGGEGDTGE